MAIWIKPQYVSKPAEKKEVAQEPTQKLAEATKQHEVVQPKAVTSPAASKPTPAQPPQPQKGK